MSKVRSFAEGAPCWTDIMVENEEQHHDLRAFLSTVFDWSWDLGTGDAGHYALALYNHDPVLGLGRREGASGEATTYFSVSDIADALARSTTRGARVVQRVTPVRDLGSSAVLTDPTGATYGLWSPGTFQGFAVAYEANAPGWFDHVSSSPVRASDFYSQLCGYQVTELDETTRILHQGEQWYASVSPARENERPQWKPVFVVDSLERIHDVVPRHGGTILVAERPVPGSALCEFTEPVGGTSITVMRAGGAGE